MKANAIIRIVLYSLIIILLMGILLPGMGIGSLRFDIDLSEEEYLCGPSSIKAEKVKRLDIEWAAGNIEIIAGNTDSIAFSETGSDTEPMVYHFDGDTLTIRHRKPSVSIGFFVETAKTLTVTVPLFWICSKLTLDIASANFSIDSLMADNVKLNSVSSKGTFINCHFDDLEIDTSSGSVHYTGTLEELDCDTASADFIGSFKETPKQINVESASGDLDITLPFNSGFSVMMDTLSGKLYTAMEIAKTDNLYYHPGESNCRISFESGSGHIRIYEGA